MKDTIHEPHGSFITFAWLNQFCRVYKKTVHKMTRNKYYCVPIFVQCQRLLTHKRTGSRQTNETMPFQRGQFDILSIFGLTIYDRVCDATMLHQKGRSGQSTSGRGQGTEKTVSCRMEGERVRRKVERESQLAVHCCLAHHLNKL